MTMLTTAPAPSLEIILPILPFDPMSLSSTIYATVDAHTNGVGFVTAASFPGNEPTGVRIIRAQKFGGVERFDTNTSTLPKLLAIEKTEEIFAVMQFNQGKGRLNG